MIQFSRFYKQIIFAQYEKIKGVKKTNITFWRKLAVEKESCYLG